jgi:hypothetical protein
MAHTAYSVSPGAQNVNLEDDPFNLHATRSSATNRMLARATKIPIAQETTSQTPIGPQQDSPVSSGLQPSINTSNADEPHGVGTPTCPATPLRGDGDTHHSGSQTLQLSQEEPSHKDSQLTAPVPLASLSTVVSHPSRTLSQHPDGLASSVSIWGPAGEVPKDADSPSTRDAEEDNLGNSTTDDYEAAEKSYKKGQK